MADSGHWSVQIFLIGFSRGAYTARMVAGIINEIGVLGKVSRTQSLGLFKTKLTI